jgi:hypothetical protein
MKLAACYTIFNNLELLEKSIEQIYNSVDVIIIGYQLQGWNGRESTEILPFIEQLKTCQYSDKFRFTCYDVDTKITPKANEINKHNQMLDFARNVGCTHFFISACDHFYNTNDFNFAKKIAADFDVTLSKMFTYYKYPTWQLTPIEDYCMPFIMRIYNDTKFIKAYDYPQRVDPAIKVNTCKTHYTFSESELMMHHYSMVRIDVNEKFSDSASRFRWEASKPKEYLDEYNNYDFKSNPGVKYFQGRKIKIVDDYFTLDTLV